MPRTRQETDALLDALDARLPALLDQYPDEGEFWAAFAGETETLVEQAGPDDAEHVRSRIDCMLARFELIPGDGFDPKCAPPQGA